MEKPRGAFDMSKVVLHIGTHKTATTTLQDVFWENASLLAKRGLVYPRLGRATGHHGLKSDWGRLPPVYDLVGGSRGKLRELAKSHADKDTTLFLSSEEFSRGGAEAGMLDEIRGLLEGFDEIEVVCTLRTQWQFLQSIYQEMSRVGMPPRPPLLVEEALKTGMFRELWVDFNQLYDWLLESFDESEITLLDFDSVRRGPGGVIGAFLTRYCPDVEPGDLELVNEGMSNVSNMPAANWAANVMSEPRNAPKWLVALTEVQMKELYGREVRSSIFTRAEIAELNATFEPLNARLAERRADVQPGFAISSADGADIGLHRGEVGAMFWVQMARRLAQTQMGPMGGKV